MCGKYSKVTVYEPSGKSGMLAIKFIHLHIYVAKS